MFNLDEGATHHTHSNGVESMGTPSDVTTVHPPTPPINTNAPSTDIDMADNPES